MGLIGELISEFAHAGESSQSQPPQQQQQGSYNSSYGSGPQPPPVQPPWIARWDDPAQRWLYINEQTGARTFEHPGSSYQEAGYYQGGPPPSQGGYGGAGYEQRQGYAGGGGYEEERKSGHSGLMYGAVGAAAGLAGGALLMHEGEKIEENWDADKARLESGIDNAEQDVADFPNDAARWTGEKVQEVEDIPQDVEQSWDRAEDRIEGGWDRAEDRAEQKWDDAVQDVEDVPQDVESGVDDAAGWVGEKVGDVERFGDDVERFGEGVEDSYEQGREEGRE